MLPKVLAVVAVLIVAVAGAVAYGALRRDAGTRDMRARLEALRVRTAGRTVDFRELHSLPAPVQRYFRSVLKDGQPIVAAVTVEHTGTFNMSESSDQWKPFSSTQRVVTSRPGFDWDGRVAMMPGVPVHVHDAYIAGEGILHAAILGLVPVADLRGGDEIASGELMRFFAEAAWYPTALLPSQGVEWEALDDDSARATLRDGDIAVTLSFHFDRDGLIDTVRAEARPRMVGGKPVPTPWQGRFWNYTTRDGVRVPTDGEVAWQLPEGDKPYWRGHISELTYEYAR